jgi:ABC-type glutathione transport system ATPase component
VPELEDRTSARDADASPLLEVDSLVVSFRRPGGQLITAVDDVSFKLDAGQTLGLVGESGCGKTSTGRAILRLVPISSGRVRFEGRDLAALRGRALKTQRQRMQIIFQDPAGSLNPRMRVGRIVSEPLEVHRLAYGAALGERVVDLLARCGLGPGTADRYAHELSGGERQRVAIARAIALRPRLIVCDEPTSALDVSIQSQILNLLDDLQSEFGIAYLFISHDMAVVRHICDHVAVMRAGQIVESGGTEQIIRRPRHPYTRSLVAAVPAMDRLAPLDREDGGDRPTVIWRTGRSDR